MHVGDIITKTVKKYDTSSFTLILERDWLEHMGFTEKELAGGEIDVVFKAEVSANRHIPYVGMGRRANKSERDAEDVL